jgi:hypothetical protein
LRGAGGHLDRSPRVEEQGTGAAREHVFNGTRHLVTRGVNDLGFGEGQRRMQLQ